MGLKDMALPAATLHRTFVRADHVADHRQARFPDLPSRLFSILYHTRNVDWLKKDYRDQLRRLAHAREHAQLAIQTDALTPEAVLQKALEALTRDA